MPELNKNSSKEEIQAYIDNIIQRDRNSTKKVQKVQQIDIQKLKQGMTSKLEHQCENNQVIEFDNLKTKVLKYIVYKKRTEKEVRQKFSSSSINQELLDDVVENLKESGYINDESYIQKAVNEFLNINTLSLKEIRNKLYAKGLERDIIDTYFSKNEEILEEYEIDCAKKMVIKKQKQMEQEEIENFLYRKGYTRESVQKAFEDE